MKYELYYKPTCPYCHKVMDFMESKKIDIPLVNIEEGNHRQELIAIGGKAQVPCLVIDGKALYESSDIIDYLYEHLS